MVLIRYYFLILNATLVLGMNVSGDILNKTSDVHVCMAETLLFRSCIKICGDTRCDMHSFCGEDKRCLHCSDALCKSPPIGCEISCAWRFTGNVGFFLTKLYDFFQGDKASHAFLRNTTKLRNINRLF